MPDSLLDTGRALLAGLGLTILIFILYLIWSTS